MPNRLSTESSPYLLQHANNPVDWYPWGSEAFAAARATNKPILLSVGYSSCHWCHVMAHESFEDDTIAAVMNRLFVNIKVDREERPDIDKIYQTAHQLLTQRGGGWPLTMFLDGEHQRPFFGGTYFPNEARHGIPAFSDLLEKVSSFYIEQRDDVRKQSQQLLDIFKQLEPTGNHTDKLSTAPLKKARDTFAQSFDRDCGGFGSAPKFPQATTINRLLRDWRLSANSTEPDLEALLMSTLTLTRMAEGGIFDHVGGGFCRYAVDRAWQIPHFEKMLYDNGPLLALYAQAAIATGESLFRDTANATADWMLADMQASSGGFFSARDADSDGEEGSYYLWTPEFVARLLGDDYAVFARRFGLDGAANFEGQWHLTVKEPMADAHERESILRSKEKLLAERALRTAPYRDEKRLSSWNALAIRGLAIAGRSLDRAELTAAAAGAVDFIEDNLLLKGRLMASYINAKAGIPAYLDDHAFLLDALLELLQSNWTTKTLSFAITVAELLLEHFEDRDSGGFYFTANDHENLIHRPKALADEAVPSGNGIAAFSLQRLGFLLGETRYLDAAERTLASAWQAIEEYPHGHVSLLAALEEHQMNPDVIVIRGNTDEIFTWRDSAAKLYAPRRMVFAINSGETNLPGALAERAPVDDETVAYRCVGTHCQMPITSWEALASELSETSPQHS